jgi:hypothetical protein
MVSCRAWRNEFGITPAEAGGLFKSNLQEIAPCFSQYLQWQLGDCSSAAYLSSTDLIRFLRRAPSGGGIGRRVLVDSLQVGSEKSPTFRQGYSKNNKRTLLVCRISIIPQLPPGVFLYLRVITRASLMRSRGDAKIGRAIIIHNSCRN